MSKQKSANTKENNSIFRVMVARIRHSTYEQLVILSEKDTEECGRQVYVADLVREAVRSYLKNRDVNKSVLDGERQLTYKN